MTTAPTTPPPSSPDRIERICAGCSYNLSGLDPHGVCPECGERIINHCFRCEYELTGLDPAGACPECAFPIEGSIGRGELSQADPGYLAKLHKGVFVIQTAIIAHLLLVFLGIFVGIIAASATVGQSSIAFELFVSVISFGLSVALIYGWWLFSSEDPDYRGAYTGSEARKLVRIMLVAAAAVAAFQVLAVFLPDSGPLLILAVLVGLASMGIFAVRFFAEMFYIRWMAPLLRNRKVLKRASTLMWLGPVLCTVGLLLFGLGPLIALVLYWNMLDWIRKDIKSIRQSAGAIA